MSSNAVGSTPALSEIEHWGTTQLSAAASHWTATADQWEDAFTQIHLGMLNPGGAAWTGTAAETAQNSSYADRMVVIGLADSLHEAAEKSGAPAAMPCEVRLDVEPFPVTATAMSSATAATPSPP